MEEREDERERREEEGEGDSKEVHLKREEVILVFEVEDGGRVGRWEREKERWRSRNLGKGKNGEGGEWEGEGSVGVELTSGLRRGRCLKLDEGGRSQRPQERRFLDK